MTETKKVNFDLTAHTVCREINEGVSEYDSLTELMTHVVLDEVCGYLTHDEAIQAMIALHDAARLWGIEK
jgi:hypothetical protein